MLPPGPFSADDPRIAAVDWISVDEQGYLVVEGKAGWGDDLPTSHCSPHSTRRPGPADLPPREKSRTTRPTKPSQTSGTPSRIRTPRVHRLRRESHRGRAESARRTGFAHPGHRQHHARPQNRGRCRRLRRPRARRSSPVSVASRMCLSEIARQGRQRSRRTAVASPGPCGLSRRSHRRDEGGCRTAPRPRSDRNFRTVPPELCESACLTCCG